ncbi:MAG: hypothetical protein JJV97_06550 [SAR324 cluster bacterium]|nr:hypothetical protein [SAR324 cluster bacterium]
MMTNENNQNKTQHQRNTLSYERSMTSLIGASTNKVTNLKNYSLNSHNFRDSHKIRDNQKNEIKLCELELKAWSTFRDSLSRIKLLLLNMCLFLERTETSLTTNDVAKDDFKEDWQIIYSQLMKQDKFLVNLCLLGNDFVNSLEKPKQRELKTNNYFDRLNELNSKIDKKTLQILRNSLRQAFFYSNNLSYWLVDKKLNPILLSLYSFKVAQKNLRVFEYSPLKSINILKNQQGLLGELRKMQTKHKTKQIKASPLTLVGK